MPELKDAAIEKIARFGRDHFTLLIVCIAGLGTAHILVRTDTYGAVIEGDSVYFLSTASNFLAGEGWRDYAGRPMVGWPPLFPLLLAALDGIGIEPLEAGRWINAAAFGLIILVAGCWLHSNLRSRLLGLAATAILAASLPLSNLASRFLTDPLFVLFTLLALIWLAAFLHRGRRTSLWWAAVFTALAAITRYPGVVLIGVGVLLLLGWRTRELAARLKDTIVFGAVSSLPLAGVLMYNRAVSKSLTGWRGESGQSLSDGLSQIVDVFRTWVVPPNTPDEVAYLLWLVVGFVGLAAVVLGVPRMSSNSYRSAPEAAPPSVGLRPAFPFGVFAGVYLLSMVNVPLFVLPVAIQSRYLLPVYVPLLLAAVFLLDRFLSIEATGRTGAIRSVLTSVVLLGACAHIGFSVDRNLHITRQAWTAGNSVSINSSYWENSEILHYIRDNPINGRIFSDDPALTWFWSRTAAPGEHHRLPAEIHNFTSAIMEWTDGDGGHVLWFRKWKPAYDLDELDIRVLPGMEPVAELAYGVVFRVTASEPFDEAKHRARKQRYVQQFIEQAGEQVARAGWSVYRKGRKLIYRKEPCAPADVQAKIVLHVLPTDPNDLPADSKWRGFDSLGFYFDQRGFRLDDQCIAIAQLPDYPIGRIRVGQWIADGNRTVWEAEFLEIGG